MPRRPSSDASKAVSSPQTKAPAPSFTERCKRKSVLSTRSPSRPRSSSLRQGLADPLHRQRILGPNIKDAFVGPHGLGGDHHAFDDAIGKRLQEHAVHEGPGVAFVAVADDIFLLSRRGSGGGPFLPRGKTGPAAAPQPAGPDLLDDLLGREVFQAVPQGLEAVVADILVQVGRIDLAAVLGGHVPLRAKERADRPVADVDRAVGHRVGHFVAEETIDPAGRAMRHPPPKALGLVLRKHDGPGIFGLHTREELRRSAAGRDQFHQRRLMAHPHAADLFHHRRGPRGGQGAADGIMDFPAALGHAARTQADADLAHWAIMHGRRQIGGTARGIVREKGLDHFAGTVRVEIAVGHMVDLDDRGQRAAAKASHLLDREQPLGIGIVATADAEVTFQGVLHQFRAFHMAGRAVADADDVLADRPVAELCVKCGNSRDRRRGDFGQPADSLHGLAGQIAKMRLNGLQNGDHGLGAPSQTGDGFIDELADRDRSQAKRRRWIVVGQIHCTTLQPAKTGKGIPLTARPQAEADRHEHFTLDRHSVATCRAEMPALANRGQCRLVERGVAAGGFQPRTPHRALLVDDDPQRHHALDAAGQCLGRIRGADIRVCAARQTVRTTATARSTAGLRTAILRIRRPGAGTQSGLGPRGSP